MTSGLKNGITRATNLCPRRFRGRILQKKRKALKTVQSTSFKQPGGIHSPKRQTFLLREMNQCVRKNTLRNSHKRVVRLWCPIIHMNIFIPVYSSSSVKSKHPSTNDADSNEENSRDSNTIGNLTKEINPKHSGLRPLSFQHGCISKTCGCKTQSAISYANNDVVTTTETAMI